MLADEKSYWEKRITALNGLIQETLEMVDVQGLMEKIKRFPTEAGTPEEARKSVVGAVEHEMGILKATAQALEDFQQFSKATLGFFVNGFYDSPHLLKRSVQYPPPMVLHNLLNELSLDLEIYQRSLQQRRMVNGGVSKQLLLLSVGDRVAAAALRPAYKAKFLEPGTAITHLGGDFDIRLIPYSPAIVIEMPFTAGNWRAEPSSRPIPSHEHLALLHEVGHHVYHHGTAPNMSQSFEGTLTQELFRQGITGGLANWLEELFADIYGLLVGGPLMALSYQERLSQESPAALTVDSGDHPIAILRPLIQDEVLRMIRAGSRTLYRNAPALLDRNWIEFAGGRDLKNEVFQPLGVSRPISGGTIVQGLAPIIHKILDALAPLQVMAAEVAWSKDVSAGQGLKALTDQLEMISFLEGTVAQMGSTKAKSPAPVEMYQKLAGKNLSETEWLPLLHFEGWSTEFSVGDMPSSMVKPLRVGDVPS
jgi:hypothetical protein